MRKFASKWVLFFERQLAHFRRSLMVEPLTRVYQFIFISLSQYIFPMAMKTQKIRFCYIGDDSGHCPWLKNAKKYILSHISSSEKNSAKTDLMVLIFLFFLKRYSTRRLLMRNVFGYWRNFGSVLRIPIIMNLSLI